MNDDGIVRPLPATEHGNMIRNEADEWPEDAPVGTFDISQNGVEGYPGCTAHILFECPNAQRCSVLLGPTFVARPSEGALNIWAWDGNVERPTITPSINCIAEQDGKPTGGCGWHGYITAGVIK